MIYLLIDTCSLLNIVNSNGYSRYLLELESYLTNKTARLLTHEHVINEWNKHKEKDKKRKENRLQKNFTTNEVHFNSVYSSNDILLINNGHLSTQYEQVDALLSKAIVVPTPKVITDEIGVRLKGKIPPFHNKPQSGEDWEILGSSCIYCDIHNINKLFFLSGNHNEFGESENLIHPKIQERFNVNIQYFSELTSYFETIKDAQSELIFPSYFYDLTNPKYSHKSSVKKTDLESVKYLYDNLYSEIEFIPIHILKKYYPFTETEGENPFYSNFALYYVKDSLPLSLKSSILLDDEEVELSELPAMNDSEEKKFVKKKLINNLIFNLYGKNSSKSARLVIHNGDDTCMCIRCMYNRFEFSALFKQLDNKETVLIEDGLDLKK